MDVELREVRDFLAAHHPFDSLPAQVLDRLPSQMFVRYFRRGASIVGLGAANSSLFVLRSGAVDIHRNGVELVERAEPGASFGTSSALTRRPSRYAIVAIEDCLVLVLPGEAFHELISAHPKFADFYATSGHDQLSRANAESSADRSGRLMLNTQLADMFDREPVTGPPTLTIQEAAQVMSANRVSALLITDADTLVGIVTDRDLRTEVVASGRSVTEPVSCVMTRELITVSPQTTALDAMVEMVSRGVHHLPVLAEGRLLGIITAGDLMRLETHNPIFLVRDIAAQTTVAGLAEVTARLPWLMRRLLDQNADADEIQRISTGVADATTRRLLELAEGELGAPPVGFAWVALGSQARMEHQLGADQDHLLVLDDAATEADDQYFAALAEYVTAGLEQCGYRRCPGNAMSTNPRWRQPLHIWSTNFHRWITEPDPEALLRAQIFFDARHLAGRPELSQGLRDSVLALTPHAPRFLGHLATHAVDRPVPIGFFRSFVLERAGEHQQTVDLKAGGVAPIVELARVYALAKGLPAVNTLERLAAVVDDGLSQASVERLTSAWRFISLIRLRHQLQQFADGIAPDNHVAPDSLSAQEKRHLRDAFMIVQRQQQGLAFAYQTQLMS